MDDGKGRHSTFADGLCYTQAMKRERAIAILKAHEAELRALGVLSLSLFGSTARDEAGDQADVDLVVKLADDVPRGFRYFGRLGEIERLASRILGSRVDVVSEGTRRPAVSEAIERERVIAF